MLGRAFSFNQFQPLVVRFKICLDGLNGFRVDTNVFGMAIEDFAMAIEDFGMDTEGFGMVIEDFGMAIEDFGMVTEDFAMRTGSYFQDRDVLFDCVEIWFHPIEAFTHDGLRFTEGAEFREQLLKKYISPPGFVLGRKGRFLGWFFGGFHGNDLTTRRDGLSNFRPLTKRER